MFSAFRLSSSHGVGVCGRYCQTQREKDTIERIRSLHASLGCNVMIEEYIGETELYMSVYRNHKLTVLPTDDLFFEDIPETEPRFATARAKWDGECRSKWGIRNGRPPYCRPRLRKGLPEFARQIYTVLKIKPAGRLDLRLTSTRPRALGGCRRNRL